MNALGRTKVIDSARFHASYGKWSNWKAAALEFTWRSTQDQYRELAKFSLLDLALDDPEGLLELAKALCWVKRYKHTWRYKCPNGHALVNAYTACASFPPTFSEVKDGFIAKFGKKKWNGGNEDDKSHGDFSARKTLKSLGLPLKEKKKGRPAGAKSQPVGPQGVREGIAKK